MVESVVSALRELDCFGLVEVSRPDVQNFGAQSFRAVQQEYEKHSYRANTRLHADHIPVVDEDGKLVDWEGMILGALDLGFDSVMIDGSRLSLEENIEVTCTVVEMAFRSGKGFTDPEEAGRFVKATRLDWLSVAMGNIHGAISGAARDKKKVNARLNIRHLRTIVSATNVPIVLQGGSGIQQESVLASIRNGVTKINIGTSIRQEYERGLSEKEKSECSTGMCRKRNKGFGQELLSNPRERSQAGILNGQNALESPSWRYRSIIVCLQKALLDGRISRPPILLTASLLLFPVLFSSSACSWPYTNFTE